MNVRIGLQKKRNQEIPVLQSNFLFSVLPFLAVVFCVIVSFSLFMAAAQISKTSLFPLQVEMRIHPAVQVYYLLQCMAWASILFFVPSKFLRVVVFLGCLGGLCFICQAIGVISGIYRYVFAAVVVQASFLFSLPFSGAAVFAVLCSCLLTLLPHVAFSSYVSGINFYEGLFLCVVAAVSFFSSATVKIAHKNMKEIMDNLKRFEEIMDRLSDSNLAYQNYAMLTERKAVEKERNRISREIHDIIGYTMTNVLMLIQAAIHSQDAEKKDSLLENAVNHLTSSVDEARLVLRRLRERDESGIHGAVLFFNVAQTFQEITGIKTRVDFGNAPREFNRSLERTIQRMLQEALTNSFKHGKADEITVSFWCEDNLLSVRIHDNGCGAEHRGSTVREGIGIKGMRERITDMGGHLSTVFAEDGFIVQAVFPLTSEEDE